jgi:hypothetical protein
MTYRIVGSVYLYGTTILEGGAVIKFDQGSTHRLYSQSGWVDCRTHPYRPAMFTAKDDNSAGATISGSTGSPSGPYAEYALLCSGPTGPLTLEHLQVRHANFGMLFLSGGGHTHTVRHVQFVDCQRPIYGHNSTLKAQNLLMSRVGIEAFHLGSGVSAAGEHVTIHGANRVVYPSNRLTLTNSLLISVTNWTYSFAGAHNATNPSSAVFEPIGAGHHYLAAGSPYRNAGTTNLSAGLLAELRQRTTYPPLVRSNVLATVDTTLWPVVSRASGPPALGYHYSPIDYLAHVWTFTNCVLTISEGTVIGFLDSTGLWLQDGAQMDCQGTPLVPNRFVDYRTVQEQPLKLGDYHGPSSGMPVNPYRYGGVGSPARFRFTEFSRLASSAAGYDLMVYDANWAFSQLTVQDCVFGGGVSLLAPVQDGSQISFHNNLFERSRIEFAAYGLTNTPLSFRNNLLRGGSLALFTSVAPAMAVRDNAFDGTSINDISDPPLDHAYNAYLNASGWLHPTNATGDVVLTNFNYASGPLGSYYQSSTNLLHAGSRTAAQAGLYHHTVLANQVKAATNTVSIGYHYVAVDPATGLPVDTDGDGIPDYLEDRNGNGTVDSGETHWQSATDLGLRVRITEPKPHANLP